MRTFAITFFFFFFGFYTATGTENCVNSTCGANRPIIRFPFRIKDRQSDRCGYPGFELTCNDQNETILELPFSGKFRVKGIEYDAQEIRINDPDNCLLGRLLHLNLSGTPFKGFNPQKYTFFNCSSKSLAWPFTPIPCLSSSSYTVLATFMELARSMPTSCRLISTVSVPIHLEVFEKGFSRNLSHSLRLTWDEPNCKDCKARGGNCRFKSNTGPETGYSVAPRRARPLSPVVQVTRTVAVPVQEEQQGATIAADIVAPTQTVVAPTVAAPVSLRRSSRDRRSAMSSDYEVYLNEGLPRSASYAIIIGVFIPALMVIIGLGCYVYGRIKGHGGQHHPNAESSSSTIYPQTNIVMMGLDGPTIESYPKLVLGESRRLPQPNDGTCPICLSEYRPKDTLKCIPECKHFFHADCIDEWLRINATCPVCRNSPQRLSPINAP
ncbi:hypothetical protein HHK36_029138 [Tetracentron sinense]|uniref:RING-type E3 ubiquitin transferase n=1 Tax=Tetracentron sinense TaxID=13715 RepID=A0A834YEI3_TETSI|nr:hypothetical protein HHK36_029138 [Tetracentron sinense]